MVYSPVDFFKDPLEFFYLFNWGDGCFELEHYNYDFILKMIFCRRNIKTKQFVTKCVPVWFQRQDWIFVVEFLGKENTKRRKQSFWCRLMQLRKRVFDICSETKLQFNWAKKLRIHLYMDCHNSEYVVV